VGTSPERLDTPALLNRITSRSLARPSVTAGTQLVRIGPNSHRKNPAGRTAVDNDDLETLLGALPAELGMPPPSINIVVKSSGVTDVLRRTKPSSPHLTPGGRRL
jgi:hypothetical protein